jgi:hypothetical protein
MVSGLIAFILSIILTIAIMVGCYFIIIKVFPRDKQNLIYEEYLKTRRSDEKRDFVVKSFKEIPVAANGQVAFIMGAEAVPYVDLELPVNKNYAIIAFDEQRILYDVLIPDSSKNYKIISNWNEDLPSLDIVMASFVFLGHYSKGFNLSEKLWHYIDSKIKPGGYFIGNFFDPDFNMFDEKFRDNKMSFLTKDQVLFLFKDYDILNFEEVKKPIEIDKKEYIEHYYEVFAKKK